MKGRPDRGLASALWHSVRSVRRSAVALRHRLDAEGDREDGQARQRWGQKCRSRGTFANPATDSISPRKKWEVEL